MNSFSYEWAKFYNTQLDSVSGTTESLDAFVAKAGFKDLEGKLVLDVGCGAGRYMEIAQKFGGKVVGIDASTSVYSARRNLDGVDIIRADIFNLPFRDGVFDRIFSIGVLHHTNDTRAAFLQLPRLLKHGGEIAVWVCPVGGFVQRALNAVSDFYRLFTTQLPLRLMYALCHLAVPIYHLKRIWLLGRIIALLAPSSGHPNPQWRILDTFDWYTPKYQHKHTYEQVVDWFLSAGLCNVKRLGVPVAVRGMKPWRN